MKPGRKPNPHPGRHPRLVIRLGEVDYEWLGNIADPKKQKLIDFETHKILGRLKKDPRIIFREPGCTRTRTVEQLLAQGMQGIYRRIELEQDIQQSEEPEIEP